MRGIGNHPLTDLLWHLQRCSVCDPAKIYFRSKLSYVLFCNSTHETGTWIANRWETSNSKPPGPIIVMGQSETLSQQLDHIHYTLFCRCTALLGLLPATATCTNKQSRNQFPDPNRQTLDSLHPILLCKITYRAPLEMLLEWKLVILLACR